MNGRDHYAEARTLLRHSQDHTDQGNSADDKIAELAAAQAQVHATLALFDRIQEIGDQLDTINRPARSAKRGSL